MKRSINSEARGGGGVKKEFNYMVEDPVKVELIFFIGQT